MNQNWIFKLSPYSLPDSFLISCCSTSLLFPRESSQRTMDLVLRPSSLRWLTDANWFCGTRNFWFILNRVGSFFFDSWFQVNEFRVDFSSIFPLGSVPSPIFNSRLLLVSARDKWKTCFSCCAKQATHLLARHNELMHRWVNAMPSQQQNATENV